MVFDPEQLRYFPECAGVYIMKNAEQKVLYIGKAKNLKKRLKQYFNKSGDKRAMIPLLRQEVEEVETMVLTSEVEALILESSLIKKYKPKYNAIFRDDKSYCKILLSTRDDWPRLFTLRKKSFSKVKGKLYGPFICGFAAKQTLEIINKIVPIRECSDQEFHSRTRPCILYEMGRCLAPCVGKCTPAEYQKSVKKAERVLTGNDNALLKELQSSMEKASEAMEYERAGELLRLIRQVEKNMSEQYVDVELKGEIHVLAIYHQKGSSALCLLPFLNGKMQRAELFFPQSYQDDGELYVSFITQYYKEAFSLPELILLPQALPQAKAVEDYLFKSFQKKCQLFCPQKGKKRQLVQLAVANATQALLTKDKKKEARQVVLAQLKESLASPHQPNLIYCVDISHLSQSYPVASLVVYRDGEKDKTAYRKYKIEPALAGDDYKAMEEVLDRCFSRVLKEKKELPSLLIIDGGKGQLGVGLRVLEALKIKETQVISLVKEKGRHDKGMTLERAFIGKECRELSFSAKDPCLLFLQKVRDEAHRFAIDYQRKRVEKATVKSSLWEIPGIGKKKARELLKYFGSIKNILKAKPEEILAIPCISKKDLSHILAFMQQEN